MAKLRVLSGREVCQILTRHGFVEVRRRGSHVVMQRRIESGTVTVDQIIRELKSLKRRLAYGIRVER